MKMKNTYLNHLVGIVLCVVSLFSASCSNPFVTLNGSVATDRPIGNNSLFVRFSTENGRSVLPASVNLIDLSDVTLTLKRTGYSTITKTVNGSDAVSGVAVESLAQGVWQLSVEASISSGIGPAFASADQSVTIGSGPSIANVTLIALQTGNGFGDISFNLSWPSARSDSVVVEWRETLTGATITSQPFTVEADTASGTLSIVSNSYAIKSGNYFLTIYLKKGLQTVATLIEAVAIYDTRISSKTKVLLENDIAQPPAKPVSLSLRGILTPSGISLSWDDISITETGYRVYRKINTGLFSEKSVLDANAEAFTDTDLVSGDKVTYRIVALNSFGESESLDSSEITWAPDLAYDETSSVSPAQIVVNGGSYGVYNWDQTITITKGGTLGTIQYSIDNGETWATYNSSSKPTMVNGNTWHFLTRIDFGSGVYSQPIGDYYEIDYTRYSLSGSVSGGIDRGSNQYTSSGENITMSVSYTPVCGETFGILHYQQKNFINETLLPNLWNDMPLLVKNNRLDSFTGALDKTTAYTLAIPASLASDSGKIASGVIIGGLAQRDKVFLKIVGRSYAADPASGANTDLSNLNGNIREVDSFIVFPKLDIPVIDMYDRPEVTPYLWMRKEPVVKVQVTQTDYFTKDTSAAPSGTGVYFRVQYGVKNWPYGLTATNISWQTNLNASEYTSGGNTVLAWADPDLSETGRHTASVDQTLQVIKSDDFSFSSRNGGTTDLIPAEGWAFYEIDNPYCSYRMGESGHYSEISGTTGELNTKAFRTTVRFRVRAWNPGFRTSTVKKSFESSTVSPFDITNPVILEGVSVKRLDSGTTSFTSDMPAKYRSYPIEVYEQYEGWDTGNDLNTSWYEKQGVTWYGDGLAGAKNEVSDSRYKNFDYSKTKVIIYSHGWQRDGFYGLPVYTGWNSASHPNVTDWTSWNTTYSGQEWYSSKWRAQGYNMGFFHWNKMAMGKHMTTFPGSAEKKIWYPHSASLGGGWFESMHSNSMTDAADQTNSIADATRSGTVGMIFAQEVVDSLPSNYHPAELIFAGHSLGNNVISNGTQKLILRRAEDANVIPLDRIPTRMELLDPFWGNNDDGVYSYVSGENVRGYSDVFHKFGKTESARNYIGIPVQWYKTSSLTETLAGYNDSNNEFHQRTNFTKFYFGSCDNGYIATGTAKRLDGNLHSEAFNWFFRSIDRSQDDTATIITTVDLWDSKGSVAARPNAAIISARSRTSALWNRLEGFRMNKSTFRWFEMNKYNSPLINQSMSTTDDWFFQWKTYDQDTSYFLSWDGYMNM